MAAGDRTACFTSNKLEQRQYTQLPTVDRVIVHHGDEDQAEARWLAEEPRQPLLAGCAGRTRDPRAVNDDVLIHIYEPG